MVRPSSTKMERERCARAYREESRGPPSYSSPESSHSGGLCHRHGAFFLSRSPGESRHSGAEALTILACSVLDSGNFT